MVTAKQASIDASLSNGLYESEGIELKQEVSGDSRIPQGRARTTTLTSHTVSMDQLECSCRFVLFVSMYKGTTVRSCVFTLYA